MPRDTQVIEVEPTFKRRDERPSQLVQTHMTPMQMVALAVSQGADIDKISKLMDLQERYQKAEAQQAYNVAFAAFKDETVKILRNKDVSDGPLRGKSYAELFSIVNAVTPALSKHGLSASWKLTKDDKDWLEVTCTLRHSLGHSESVSMGGPPDNGGAKNAIQARASTVTYLEKYTLKAICGVSEQGDDDDGNGSSGKRGSGSDLEPYSQHMFQKNLPAWQSLIASGKKTAEQIISTVSSKAFLTEDQKAAIRKTQKVDGEITEAEKAAAIAREVSESQHN